MANKALKAARKAYNKNQQTKGGQKQAKKNKNKQKKKPVSSSWDSVREKTQTAGNKGEANRSSSVRQARGVASKASSVANSNKDRAKSNSGAVTPVKPTTGANNAHHRATSTNVTRKATERREGIARSKRAREVVGDVVKYAGKDIVATGATFLKNGGKNIAEEPDYKASGASLKKAAEGGEYKPVKTAPKGATLNQRTGTWETKSEWKSMSKFAGKAVASAEKEIEDATKNISDKKNINVADVGFVNKLIGMESTKDAKAKAKNKIEKNLSDNKLTLSDAVKDVQEIAKYGEEQGWTDDTMLTNGKTWGQMKKEAGKDVFKNLYGARVEAYKGFNEVGKVSKKDLAQLGIKGGVAMAEMLAPYIGTAGKALKGVDALSTGSKALTAAESGSRALTQAGKTTIRNTVREAIKNGDDITKTLQDLSKAVAKSDFKTNVKREILANALQDATIGTGIDYMSTQKQGLTGKEAWKYMGESALMNAALGAPIAGIAGRTGKAGKAALNNEIQSVADQTVKAVTEENRIARRLGAKGLSPEEVQKAISKPEVQEWIDLSVKEGKSGLTVEQKNHLDRLQTKVDAQRKAYDNAINESVKTTRASIGEASAIDVARLRRAVAHYENVGKRAEAKEARQLLAKAEKNFNKTLDTVQKASAKVSNDLGREFKIESADECLTAFAGTGGRVSDPSQFHGFASFDKDGNIVGYHVNKDSEQALEYTFGHEFMHGFESLGKEYDNFVEDLKSFVGDEWDEAVKNAETNYKNVENADYEKEAVANLVAKYFFAEDGTYLKKLAGEKPSLFARVYDAIKKLISGSSETDAQFKALSKQLDDMFDSLSAQQKSIITGSPDTTRLLYGGEGSIADGLEANPKIRGGEDLKDAVKDIDATYKNAISELNKAKTQFADDPMQMAVARETIRKQLVEDLSINMSYAKARIASAEKKFGDNYKAIEKVRKEVYKETGCFQTLSGDWGYLIDDRNMKFRGSNKIRTLKEAQKKGDMLAYDPKSDSIVRNPKAYDETQKRIEAIDREYQKTRTSKKRKAELRKEFEQLTYEVNMFRAFASEDGVPIGEVIDHDLLYLLYPDAKEKLNISFKNIDSSSSGYYQRGNREHPTKIVVNARLLANESDFAAALKRINRDIDIEKRTTIIHEMQHSLQGNEGRPAGGSPEEFADSYLHIYPKVYDRDREALADVVLHRDALHNKMLKAEYSGEADAAVSKYWDYVRNLSTNTNDYNGIQNLIDDFREIYPNASDEKIKQLCVEDAIDTIWHDTLKVGDTNHTPVDVRPFQDELREFISADYDAALLSETNADKLYRQLSSEIESNSAANIAYKDADREEIRKIRDEEAQVFDDLQYINPMAQLELKSGTGLWAKYLKTIDYDNIKSTMSKEDFIQTAYESMKASKGGEVLTINKNTESLVREFLGYEYDKAGLQWYGKLKNRSELMNSYPVEYGKNVRYKGNSYKGDAVKDQSANHALTKATKPANDKLDKIAPNRLTRNESGLARMEDSDIPITRRSQTTTESEASYYDNLAAGVEAAEKEMQDAMNAYTNAPVKGQMTDEVRAQVKAQQLAGKELTDAQVDTLAEAQVALHNQKVIIPESARTGTVKQIRANHGIDEDNVMLPIVKSETAKNAQSVGDAYATMSKEYPDLFPSSITDEAEQFQRLMDVSGLKGGAASRRGNYYVPKNRTMTPYKPKAKAEKVAKVDKAETAEAPKEKPPEQPKQTEQKVEKSAPKEQNPTPKETPTEKNGVIERERRDDTKKRENDTAKRAFDTLNKEYGKDQGWVDAVTGKREDGAFGKLKVKGAKEAEATVNKEFDKLGYDKLKNEYFKAEIADDPYVAMARANKLLGEIDRRLKAGEGEASALYDEATDIIEKYSGITSLGSNILSSAKKFLTSTPQGRKRVVLKEIERLEKRYKDRIKGGKIIIDDAKIDELMHATGAKADDLLDELNKEIWEQIPASLMERMNEYRHCFMLFNVKTHGRNVLGNSVFRMARALSDDMERRILNSNAARKRMGKMQGKDPSEVIINRQKVTHKELKDNYMYLFNEFHAIYDKSGSRNKFIETGRPDGVDTVKFKIMQKLINFNYAALEKEDLKGALIPAFNKSYLSYCKARCPEGTDLRKFMEQMTPAQKEKAQRYALAQGEYATFRDSCAFSDWLTAKKTMFAGQKGKTKWGTFGYRALDTVLEGALPFVKTPVNIFRRSVDYSPASLVMSIGKLARADSPEMFQLGVHQLCTGLTGTGMAGLGVFLAQQGLITVKAGEESGDAYYDRDMGYQDYSLKIRLGDKEYSWTLDWMSPMNMSLFAGAAFEKMFEKGTFDNTASLNAFFAITSPMTDMSFMSSPKDTMERFLENATRGTDGETDFAGALAQLIVGDVPKNYVSGFFPQLMSQFAGVTDKYRRDTKSTRENVYLRGWESSYRQLVNKIPWARKYLLNPKVNRMGEDVKNDENIATRIFNSFFNPANVKEITTNDEDRELINIRNHIEDKSSNLYKYFYYNFTGNPPYDLANGKRMTYDESYKYAKASRVEQNVNIKNMLGADSYKGMTWDMKANEVDGAYWIGKSAADHDVYGVNYALKVLKDDSHGKRDYNTWTTYKDNAGGSANKETFWNYYMEKERLYNRSHPNGDNTYRVKGLPAIQSGDQALIDAVGLTGQKEPELKHYWEKAQKKYGKKAKEITNKKISDAVCIMTTNIDKAGVEAVGLGMQSASAAVSAKNGKKIDQDEYRALGQFWNSAQAGGGLQLKYNKDGKYDLKNLEKYSKQLDKKLDNRPDGVSQKDVACDFIENDLGITNVDEAACVFQVLYLQGHSNPASKNSWKNPYKDQINDHLEWGKNKDGEWGGKTKGSGWGRGRRGWRRGHGGGGGGSKKGTAPKTDTGAIKGKVTDPFSTSNGSKDSNLNDAYRKRAQKLREATRKSTRK